MPQVFSRAGQLRPSYPDRELPTASLKKSVVNSAQNFNAQKLAHVKQAFCAPAWTYHPRSRLQEREAPARPRVCCGGRKLPFAPSGCVPAGPTRVRPRAGTPRRPRAPHRAPSRCGSGSAAGELACKRQNNPVCLKIRMYVRVCVCICMCIYMA